jgi:hypothetical protein
MCYLVTWNEPTGNGRADRRVIVDTETEARERGELQLKAGALDVAVWKQIATPTLEQVVQWSEADND